MDEPRTPPPTDRAKQLRARGRASRGAVATYIHELSDRHGAARRRPPKQAPEDAPA